MTYAITVPAGSDRYSLVSDLQVMASEISDHLDSVYAQTVGAIKAGDAPTLTTISTTSAATFPSIVITGTRPNSRIVNDATNGFGLKTENIYLTSNNGLQWTSNAQISVPNGGTGTQVINRNALDTEVSALNALIAGLNTRLTAIEANYATKSYVDSKDSALTASVNAVKADISSLSSKVSLKADLYQQVNKVLNAQNAINATNASYATDAGMATRAGTANNSDKFRGRLLAVGRTYYGTLGGQKKGEITINHNLGYVPVILANAYNDGGVMSIACSVGSIDGTSAVIKVRNLNDTVSESFSVNWVAI